MAGEWTRMHGPSESAPQVTELVARCKVCGAKWVVKGDPPVNTKGCAFCDADETAIVVQSEEK